MTAPLPPSGGWGPIPSGLLLPAMKHKEVYDLYVDGKRLSTLSKRQANSERKRLGILKGVEFRMRLLPSKSVQQEVK